MNKLKWSLEEALPSLLFSREKVEAKETGEMCLLLLSY